MPFASFQRHTEIGVASRRPPAGGSGKQLAIRRIVDAHDGSWVLRSIVNVAEADLTIDRSSDRQSISVRSPKRPLIFEINTILQH